jgi:hypothetical protein
MAYVSESRIIRRTDRDSFVVYQRFDFLWPFQDRDIVAAVSIHRNYRTGRIGAHINAVNDSTIPIKKGCIRMTAMTGEIEAAYLHRTRTGIVYSESFDPAGNFSHMPAEFVSENMPRIVLTELKKTVRKNKTGNSPESSAIQEEIERSIRNNLLPE